MSEGPDPPAGRPLRILIVEDDLDDAVIAGRAARRALGCEIEVVTDGAAAMARLTREPVEPDAKPDLILLDLHLPSVGGLDVLRALRRTTVHRLTPVIVLTSATPTDEQIVECYAAGASSFVPKPATDARVTEALRVLGAPRRSPESPSSDA